MPKVTRFKCAVCGKLTAGRVPRELWFPHHTGDGSIRFPRRHTVGGLPCAGNTQEAVWVDVETKDLKDAS